jgi:hypothetical protein
MTEQEWLECSDPLKMLEFVRGKASERKLRLFACACCRLVWKELVDDRVRRAIQLAEQFADGFVGSEDLRAVYEDTRNGGFDSPGQVQWLCALAARMVAARRLPLERIVSLVRSGRVLEPDRKLAEKGVFSSASSVTPSTQSHLTPTGSPRP